MLFGLKEIRFFFEEDFLQNIKKYIFKPLILIFYDIPKLLISSIMFFKFEIFYFFTLVLFACLTLINFKSYKIENSKNLFKIYLIFSNSYFEYFCFLCLSFFLLLQCLRSMATIIEDWLDYLFVFNNFRFFK